MVRVETQALSTAVMQLSMTPLSRILKSMLFTRRKTSLSCVDNTHDRRFIVVVSHEASRTGAPVLGLNIVQYLARSYNVVSLVMRPGELDHAFDEAAAVSFKLPKNPPWSSDYAKKVAEQIYKLYDPKYIITNSIETHLMVPAFAGLGIPCISLVHEFASYTRPLNRMRDVYDYAKQIVFPAQIVAQSSFEVFPDLKISGRVHVRPQGPVDVPTKGKQSGADEELPIGPVGLQNKFVVLGAGYVQIRKGVDLFIATAMKVRQLEPNVKFLFVWVGDGYDPVNDCSYSVYLEEQLRRSRLEGDVLILPSVSDLSPLYAKADAFFLSSRLDPQPNVGIDAIIRGIPIICFEGASGTAEILATHAETRFLVVPHLDITEAAQVICRLAQDKQLHKVTCNSVAQVGAATFDMPSYVEFIDSLSRDF